MQSVLFSHHVICVLERRKRLEPPVKPQDKSQNSTYYSSSKSASNLPLRPHLLSHSPQMPLFSTFLTTPELHSPSSKPTRTPRTLQGLAQQSINVFRETCLQSSWQYQPTFGMKHFHAYYTIVSKNLPTWQASGLLENQDYMDSPLCSRHSYCACKIAGMGSIVVKCENHAP